MDDNIIVARKNVIWSPIILAELYMSFTVFLYFFGPLEWQTQNPELLFLYLFMYQLAFGFGYIARASQKITQLEDAYIQRAENKIIKFLKYWIIINLIFTFLNAVLYGMIDDFSLTTLFEKAINGIISPKDVYNDRQLEIMEGTSMITLITVAFSPIIMCTSVLSLVYYKKIKMYQKILVVLTFSIELMRWLSIGTNKGLFDLVILLFTRYVVIEMRSKYYDNNKNKFNIGQKVTIVGMFSAVIAFFGYSIGERLNYASTTNDIIADFDKFPSNLCPEFLRSTYVYLTSYLSQGYYGMSLALTLDWVPTYGFGNSSWLMRILDQLTGINFFADTYQARLSPLGWHEAGNWHSIYTWFANDIHFVGVIFLMFAIGYFFASIVIEAVVQMKAVSTALLYLLMVGLFYVSANNQVLAMSTTFSAFWILFIYRIFNKFTTREYKKYSING